MQRNFFYTTSLLIVNRFILSLFNFDELLMGRESKNRFVIFLTSIMDNDIEKRSIWGANKVLIQK